MRANPEPLRVGMVGCGRVSSKYIEAIRAADRLILATCTDLNLANAQAVADAHGFDVADSLEALLQDESVDIVLNLTPPHAHEAVTVSALEAGKHVYSEKPLATTREAARLVMHTAASSTCLLACAPDQILTGAMRGAREMIDAGRIGNPIAATAFMMNRGHEQWHPDPAGYYAPPGGGPFYNRAGYYVGALINLFGPVAEVSAMGRITWPSREIKTGSKAGDLISVEVPTHISANLAFENGVIATVVMSFDVWNTSLPRIEIYGSEATVVLPDPVSNNGNVLFLPQYESEAQNIPMRQSQDLGTGIRDLASAIDNNRQPILHAGLAYHIVDIMESVHVSITQGSTQQIESSCLRPELSVLTP
ncbi:Gfo/Idh/MocA family protein [Kribbella soli]|uniref:Gfo/Idh/MocA family oxidoreductase n=1 Tax=Kribbella soli TaxID=1124743 RepID=A0A4R0H998_9ACTN|nr:Gfo/Idh/MocA family oxidoreductase [Kribbella soli]TCC04259.1 Gfo/Idh/MocA family oxidoreductase [Kribbella soli]